MVQCLQAVTYTRSGKTIMARRRMTGNFRFPVSRRRSTQWWHESDVGSDIPTTGNAVLIDVLDGLDTALGFNLNNITTIRNVGRLQIYDATAHQAGNYADLTYGLVVGHKGLDPLDIVQGDSIFSQDFLMLNSIRFSSVPSGGAGQTFTPHEGVTWDIRTARKLSELGKTLWFMLYGNAVNGTPNVSLSNRTLIKLP